MKARVSNLHRTEIDWSTLNDWTPEAGELIVYDPDENYSYARLKIGDGATALKDLPFFIDESINSILRAQRFSTIIDGGRITDYLTEK